MSNVPFSAGWDLERSPFHEGELAIQERVGVREKIDAQGRSAVRRYLTDQHREFFPMLPYVFMGSVDAEGRPWASMLFGEPGFVNPTSATTVSVKARPLFGDPLAENLRPGAEVALLGVQLHTRRRNRMIGVVGGTSADGFTIEVRQTLGVCPQYIQGREPEFTSDPLKPQPRPIHRSEHLDAVCQDIIAAADTYFVASVDPREEDGVTRGADVSHRGGRPGFVRVDDETTLTAPDFVGNFIFNTLGNWLIDDRGGLLFIDFEKGDLLYVAARAEIIWDGPEVRAFTGAQRLVRYRITDVIRVEACLPAHFTPPDNSPLLARTGAWTEVAQALELERDRNIWRPFRIAHINEESAKIRSFYLKPDDERGVAPHEPGQFLPIRVRIPGWDQPATRTYTLSAAMDGAGYRISVKRAGLGGVSDWLHDGLEVGDVIETMSPRGTFVFAADPRRPVVLISAGVGITPMIAMLDSLLVNNKRTRHHAPIWFVHGAANSSEQAFAAYVKAKAEMHSNLKAHIRYSRPLADDALGQTHDSEGRVDVALLKQILPFDDYEFYLCGPAPFMQSLYDGLADLGVRDARVHFESFGPASVARRGAEPAADDSAEESVVVTFAKSGKTARWQPNMGSLMELAERNGVPVMSSCRSGVCGTCSSTILAGAVDYPQPPTHEIDPGESLICMARPHPGPHLDGSLDREGVTLDL